MCNLIGNYSNCLDFFLCFIDLPIGQLFCFKPRTGAQLCQNWVEEGFLIVIDPSNKGRSYALAPRYEMLVTKK